MLEVIVMFKCHKDCKQVFIKLMKDLHLQAKFKGYITEFYGIKGQIVWV